jgi:hypothetical protein
LVKQPLWIFTYLIHVVHFLSSWLTLSCLGQLSVFYVICGYECNSNSKCFFFFLVTNLLDSQTWNILPQNSLFLYLETNGLFLMVIMQVLASKTKINMVMELVTGGELFDRIVRLLLASMLKAKKIFFLFLTSVIFAKLTLWW